MFIKDIDPARLALLTPEQMKVVERWDREAQAREKLIPTMCTAYKNADKEEGTRIGKQILTISAKRCEHDRDIMGTCIGCDEIEQILYPELLEENELE